MKLVAKYLPADFRAQYTNSVFRSKLMFGIETWGGAPQTLLTKVKKLQDRVLKIALPKKYQNKTSRQRQNILGWLPINKEILKATHKHTFKVLNWNIPEELSTQMPKNTKNLRISKQNKLDTKPKWLGSNKVTRASYRHRSYHFNTLPKIVNEQTDFFK